MKVINKIGLVLIAFAIIFPNICQGAFGDINIEDNSIMGVVPGTYVIWNITEANNAYFYGPYYSDPSHNIIMAGHQIKLTITGTTFIRETIRIPIDEYGYMYTYVIGENPCLIGTLEYHNTTTNEWLKIHQVENIAVLMYNVTIGRLYSAADIVEKYFLTILPINYDLADYGAGIVNSFYDWNTNPDIYFYSQLNITGFSYTLDTLNLTLEQKSAPYDVGYNYIKIRNDGIVSEWSYDFMGSMMTAEFLTKGAPNTSLAIPFGIEYIIPTGICIIGLIIIVRKHCHIKSYKN